MLVAFSRIFFKFVMHVTNKPFLDKLNNGWKEIRFIAIFCILRH